MKTTNKTKEKNSKSITKEDLNELKKKYKSGDLEFNSKEVAKEIIKDLKPTKKS